MPEVFSVKGVPCERCRGYRKRRQSDGRVVCADCERGSVMSDFLRCWLICTDDVCMLGYGTTRSQAVDDFLGRYTDNTFDEFAAGHLGLRINRVPEHDPGFDTPRLEYSALATIRRGYSVHCEGHCGNESLVASLDQWPDMEDAAYQGYYVNGRVLCHDCAVPKMRPYREIDSSFAIRLMEGFGPCLVTP